MNISWSGPSIVNMFQLPIPKSFNVQFVRWHSMPNLNTTPTKLPMKTWKVSIGVHSSCVTGCTTFKKISIITSRPTMTVKDLAATMKIAKNDFVQELRKEDTWKSCMTARMIGKRMDNNHPKRRREKENLGKTLAQRKIGNEKIRETLFTFKLQSAEQLSIWRYFFLGNWKFEFYFLKIPWIFVYI